MKLIKLQAFLSNCAQDVADAMSTNPEIKTARAEGRKVVAEAKADKAAARREAKLQRRMVTIAQRAERHALLQKQAQEFDLVLEKQQGTLAAKQDAIVARKVELRERLRDIRVQCAEKDARAQASEASVTEPIPSTAGWDSVMA